EVLVEGNREQGQRVKAFAHAFEEGEVALGDEEDDEGEEEVEIADHAAGAAKMGIEDLADAKAHLLTDDFAGPVDSDEGEGECGADGQAKEHLAADAGGEFP